MKSNRVFIGIKKDCETLIYHKQNGTYYDLLNKKTINDLELSEFKLISYQNIVNSKSRFKRNIINNYQKEQQKRLDINKVFIGNILKTKKIVSRDSVENTVTFLVDHVKDSALLYARDYQQKGFYIPNNLEFVDLETGQIYTGLQSSEIDKIYVDTNLWETLDNFPSFLNRYDDELSKEKYMNKKEILKKYRMYK